MDHKEAIKTYQCPGCVNGPDVDSCPSAALTKRGCTNHVPGTIVSNAGTIALGLPNGFNRSGPAPAWMVEVFSSYSEMVRQRPNLQTKFSVPVWMHVDQHGNTIIRWFSPRTNTGWSNVVLEDLRDKLRNTIEITAEDIKQMD